MITDRLWKLTLTYPNGSRVVRFKRAPQLRVGSGYGVEVPLSSDYPKLLLSLDYEGKVVAADAQLKTETRERGIGARWAHSAGVLKLIVEDVSEVRQPLAFEVSAAQSSDASPVWTVWHYVGPVLLETSAIQGAADPSKDPFYSLNSGLQVQWQQLDGRLILKMPSGEVKSLKAQRSDKGPYVAKLDNDTYVLCRAGGKDAYSFVPKDYAPQKDSFNKYLVAFFSTWLLLIGFLNFGSGLLPQTDPELLAQEELPELMKKVEIAKKEARQGKEGQGGNNMAGGGGVDTQANDPRGGGGVVSDEVVVADLQSLSGGSGVFDALGALDKQMAKQNVQTAALGPSNATANSILGALGAMSGGSKKGGGGLGLGGVGTKGFGGGGGGGSGTGFGNNGGGSGLGLGSGPRRLSFETGDSEVRGGLDRSEVDAVVRQNLAQVRFCYNRGLRAHPDLAGRLTSNFVIGGDGRVKSSNIRQSSLGVAAVEDCIRDKVAMWSFPKPRGGGEVTVNYPFLLRAQ